MPKLEKLPVESIRFVEPIDFPGQQLDGCNNTTARGGSYAISYLPALSSFELVCTRNDVVTWTEMVPKERVKKFKMVEEVGK